MTQDRSKKPGRQRTLQAATGNDADLGLWRKTVADLNEALNDVQTDIETLRIMLTSLQDLASSAAAKLTPEDLESVQACCLTFAKRRALGRKLVREADNLNSEEFTNTFKGLGVKLPALENGLRAKEEPADRRPLDERRTVTLLEQALAAARSEQPDAVPLIAHALAAASGEVVTRLPPAPPRWDEATLEEFRAYAKANPWPGDGSMTPSKFIQHHYAKWLAIPSEDGDWSGPTLWRSDITEVQSRLAAAYATEIGRDPGRLVEGLYVKPHKLPAGTQRPTPKRLVSELPDAEKEEYRRRGREYMKRVRDKKRDVGKPT